MEKSVLRTRIVRARRALPAEVRQDAARAHQRLVTALVDELPGRAITVAAYVSIGTEPATDELLAALCREARPGRNRPVQVLVPMVLPDRDLDWAGYHPDQLQPGPHGVPEPTGPRLGRSAITEADVLVVPALACARDGTRLGRGGGSYDRALARVPATTPVLALLYTDELLDALPRNAHDRPVTHAVLPSGIVELGPTPA